MATTIRAWMKGGMLERLEMLDLPEGKDVTMTVLGVPSSQDVDAFRNSVGGWKQTMDADELIKNIYAGPLTSARPIAETGRTHR